MANINSTILILTLNVNGLYNPVKRLLDWMEKKKKWPTNTLSTGDTVRFKTQIDWKQNNGKIYIIHTVTTGKLEWLH